MAGSKGWRATLRSVSIRTTAGPTRRAASATKLWPSAVRAAAAALARGASGCGEVSTTSGAEVAASAGSPEGLEGALLSGVAGTPWRRAP